MKVDEITCGAPHRATAIAGLDAQRQPSENELAGAGYQVRIAEDHRETPRLNDASTAPAASAAQSNGTSAGSVAEKAEDRNGMEQAEHDLLADLRRARRSLRHQDMDQSPAVARPTPGQRIA